MAQKTYPKNVPPRLLPQKQQSYDRYNQQKWKKPLPPEYKKTAKAIMMASLENIPVESVIDPKKNKFAHDMYTLAQTALKRCSEINYLLKKTEILPQNEFLDPWIARILIAELLWGNQYLKSGAKEVEAIKYYEEDLREAYLEVTNIVHNPLDKNKFKLPTYVRINTLSISIEDTIHAFFKEGWNLLPRSDKYSDYLNTLTNLGKLGKKDFVRDYHISELLVFPPGISFYEHPGFKKGKFLLQDKGSCLSSFLLNPKPGSVVLDICAAPGLKTNHLANIMGNNGVIYANDIHPIRYGALCKLLNLTNVTCAKTVQDDYLSIKLDNPDDIKYILIDPTCTFSGIFYGVSKSVQKLRIQRNKFSLSMILRYTLQNFPSVKRVVYTTCSLYPEEGEMIVDDALKEIGDSFTLLDVKEMLWNEWESLSLPEYECANKCLRIIPEFDLCQGYFIAVFERNFDIPVPQYVRRFKKGSKVYTDAELEKVEKVSRTGEIIQTYVPKDRKEKTREEEEAILQKKLNKKNQFMAKQAKKQQMKQQMRFKNSYTNPNINHTNNMPPFTNYSPPEGIYETTHNQLYP